MTLKVAQIPLKLANEHIKNVPANVMFCVGCYAGDKLVGAAVCEKIQSIDGKKACKISGVYADGNISVYSELCKACYKFAMQKGCNEIIISVGKES